MSRRYSDAPINLIARIPTPEQLSAARTRKRSFGEHIRESGVAFLRSIGDMGTELRRTGCMVVSFVSEKVASRSSLSQVDEKPVSEAAPVDIISRAFIDRSLGESERMKAVRPPDKPVSASHAPVPARFTALEPAETAVESVSLKEVAALRSELLAQRQEVARLSVQLQELKSLVASQQQVLMYLGQEMENRQMPIMTTAALAPAPSKKPRVARAKSSATAASGSRKASQKPALNL